MQVVNTNVFALNSQRALNKSQNSMQTSLERLSSGLRINRAKDDAAGLAISERFTAQIRGLEQANRNANDGISLLQTAEGSLSEVTTSLQRMRELAVQAANGTTSGSDKISLNQEFSALASEILRNANSTKFNGTMLIGSGASTLNFQIGYEAGSLNQITVSTQSIQGLSGMASVLSGISGSGIAPSDGTGASAFITAIDLALDKVSSLRADFGAAQNRLESAVRNNENIIENQSAARSRVLDADFAKETANLTRTQILQQAGVAMLAQANQLPQNALQLL
jgi:flagellin